MAMGITTMSIQVIKLNGLKYIQGLLGQGSQNRPNKAITMR